MINEWESMLVCERRHIDKLSEKLAAKLLAPFAEIPVCCSGGFK